MASIDPGRFDLRIEFQERLEGSTALGSPNVSWVTKAYAWASRVDRKSRESWEEKGPARQEAIALVDWTIRQTPETKTIASDDRILSEGEFFDVLTVRRIGREYLEITTRLRTNA